MHYLFILLGAAGAGIDEDPSPWAPKSRALLDGPAGCVEVQGTATVDLAVMQPGGWRGPGTTRHHHLTGPFTGTLRDGVWTERSADLRTTNSRPPIEMHDLMPVVGRSPGGAGHDLNLSISSSGKDDPVNISAQGAQGINLVDGILDAVKPDVTLSWLEEGEGGALILVQRAPVKGADDDEQLELRTTFPGRGAPTRLDVTLPRKIRVGDGPIQATLFDGQVHLRAASTPLGPLPTEEGVSVIFGFLGFTLGIDQRLVTTSYRPCGA